MHQLFISFSYFLRLRTIRIFSLASVKRLRVSRSKYIPSSKGQKKRFTLVENINFIFFFIDKKLVDVEISPSAILTLSELEKSSRPWGQTRSDDNNNIPQRFFTILDFRLKRRSTAKRKISPNCLTIQRLQSSICIDGYFFFWKPKKLVFGPAGSNDFNQACQRPQKGFLRRGVSERPARPVGRTTRKQSTFQTL